MALPQHCYCVEQPPSMAVEERRVLKPPYESSALRMRLSSEQNIFQNYFEKPIQSISARPRCSVSKLKYVTIKNPHNDDKYVCSLLCSQPKDTAKRQYLTFLIAQANLYSYHGTSVKNLRHKFLEMPDSAK